MTIVTSVELEAGVPIVGTTIYESLHFILLQMRGNDEAVLRTHENMAMRRLRRMTFPKSM